MTLLDRKYFGDDGCPEIEDSTTRCDPSVYPNPHTLEVIVSGNGGVSSNPYGIICPDIVCKCIYYYNEFVTLIAVPDEFYYLDAWEGLYDYIDSSDPNICYVTMNKSKKIKAIFKKMPKLKVVIHNEGDCKGHVVSDDATAFECGKNSDGNPLGFNLGITCPDDCEEIYPYNELVILTAYIDETSNCCEEIVEWKGDYFSVDGNTCIVIMDADKTIDVYFHRKLNLTVSISPNAGEGKDPYGHVYSDDGLISCPEQCKACFSRGTTITLTAVPDDNVEFLYWTSNVPDTCPDSTNPVCTFVIEKDTNITAVFLPPYKFTVRLSPGNMGNFVDGYDGKISCENSCTYEVKSGTEFTLTAHDSVCCKFKSWSGDVKDVSGNTCTVKIENDNQSVTAKYDCLLISCGSISWSSSGGDFKTYTHCVPNNIDYITMSCDAYTVPDRFTGTYVGGSFDTGFISGKRTITFYPQPGILTIIVYSNPGPTSWTYTLSCYYKK